MRPLPAIFLSSIVLGCCVPLYAANVSAKHDVDRIAIFARLPNWSGVWEPAAAVANATPVEPVNTAAWLAKRNGKKSNAEPLDNAQSHCVWGMPRLLRSLHSFEVTVTPEQTFFSYDINEFRHVWTDGRKHPLRVVPTNAGYSIGHWEGTTLVIDTIAMQSGLWIGFKGATLSPKATTEERWSQPDDNHLKVDVTIRDTVALAKPLVFSRRFQRSEDKNHLTQVQCFEESHDDVSKDY